MQAVRRRTIDYFFFVILAMMSLMLTAVLALFFRNLLVFGGVKHVMPCVVGVAATWFCISMWMWTLKWRKLDQESYWRFIKGPRPRDEGALSAWRWGRQVLFAWLGILIAILITAAVLYWVDG